MATMTVHPSVQETLQDQRPEQPQDQRRERCRRYRVVASVAALAALVLLIVFVVLGVTRMVDVTAAGRALPATTRVAAGYDASVWPLGFTVHWSDGSDETHLWW